jgi:hypothetical protein
MSVKLAILKTLGKAAFVGMGAHLSQQPQPGQRRVKKQGCTPCAAFAASNAARQAVKTGKF